MQPLRSWRAARFTARRSALWLALCACLVALLGAATLPARAAGAVEVRFVDLQRYADIGWRTLDRERNLELLRAHFQGLAARLPDGQRLAIEVLDVDLAGEEVPGDRLDPVRVLRGQASGKGRGCSCAHPSARLPLGAAAQRGGCPRTMRAWNHSSTMRRS